MRLSLQNIGKIKEANVELNGITVIAGQNDSGKSTVGKVLYSVFNAFFELEIQMKETRKALLSEAIKNLCQEIQLSKMIYFQSDEIAAAILSDFDGQCIGKNDTVKLSDIVNKEINDNYFDINESTDNIESKEDFLGKIIEKTREIISVSDEAVFIRSLQKRLNIEFKNQINNIFTNGIGEIKLQIKDTEIKINIENNKVVGISDNLISLRTQAIYFDDPFILDGISATRYIFLEQTDIETMSHRQHLKKCLLRSEKKRPYMQEVFDEIIIDDKLSNILSKINEVCGGEMRRVPASSYRYIFSQDSKKSLDVENLSTGLKSFVIIKSLLLNGYLKEKGVIVLDEPEVHLHPEWQLIFAEIIVLLQKEFDMHILINTHSPYFLRAIEVYSYKYDIEKVCKYYMASSIENVAILEDKTNNTESIYAKLAYPLQLLENERYMDKE